MATRGGTVNSRSPPQGLPAPWTASRASILGLPGASDSSDRTPNLASRPFRASRGEEYCFSEIIVSVTSKLLSKTGQNFRNQTGQNFRNPQ
jgi:hypothetical protein